MVAEDEVDLPDVLSWFKNEFGADVQATGNTVSGTISSDKINSCAGTSGVKLRLCLLTKLNQEVAGKETISNTIIPNWTSVAYPMAGDERDHWTGSVRVPDSGAGGSGIAPGTIQVTKLVKGTQQTIKDVVFRLFKLTPDGAEEGKWCNGQDYAEMITGEDGIASVSDLDNGQYLIKEISGPDWVVIPSKGVTVTLGGTSGIDQKIENEVKTVDISGAKTWNDVNDRFGLRPTSIVIRLLADGEEVGQQTVQPAEDGSWSYTFEGYPMAADGKVVEYAVVEDPVAHYKTTIKGNGIVNDLIVTKVTFTKKALGGEELPGATIRTLKDDDVIDEWVSTTDPHEIELPDGDYVMHEEAAPEGYLVATDIPFTVENGNAEATTAVNMDDKPWPTIEISKVDATTKAELPGAKLAIRQGGKVVAEWESTTEPHRVQLAPGTYTLIETTAPDGYEVAEAIEFEVGADGLVQGERVVMEDEPSAPGPELKPEPTPTPMPQPSGGGEADDNKKAADETKKKAAAPTTTPARTTAAAKATTARTGDMLPLAVLGIALVAAGAGAMAYRRQRS